MPDPTVPPELAGFLQQLRSLVPPACFSVPAEFVRSDSHANAEVLSYIAHLSNHGAAILAQVEQVLVALARRAHAAERPTADPFPDARTTPRPPRLAPDSAAEDALFALMHYLISTRGTP